MTAVVENPGLPQGRLAPAQLLGVQLLLAAVGALLFLACRLPARSARSRRRHYQQRQQQLQKAQQTQQQGPGEACASNGRQAGAQGGGGAGSGADEVGPGSCRSPLAQRLLSSDRFRRRLHLGIAGLAAVGGSPERRPVQQEQQLSGEVGPALPVPSQLRSASLLRIAAPGHPGSGSGSSSSSASSGGLSVRPLAQAVLRALRTAALFLGGAALLSPLYASLAASVSTDSIIFLSVVLLAAHLALWDYRFDGTVRGRSTGRCPQSFPGLGWAGVLGGLGRTAAGQQWCLNWAPRQGRG